MAEPLYSGNSGMRFSYASDVGVLGIGKNVAESAAVARREVEDILEWVDNYRLTKCLKFAA